MSKKIVRGISFIERPGSGPVVVFLHGIGSNAHSFDPLFEILPKDLHLIAWNAPGYMDSLPLETSWPIADDYAEKLHWLLDELAFKHVHLVGHSLGALIATAFANTFPERVKTLILASPALGYNVSVNGEMPVKVSARISELARLGRKQFARSRAPNLVFEPERNKCVVARVESSMANIDPQGYTQAVRMLASGNLAKSIQGIQICPGFIVGTCDTVTPPKQAQEAAAAWSHAWNNQPPIREIEAAGHATYVQKPEAFANALLDLIKLKTEPMRQRQTI